MPGPTSKRYPEARSPSTAVLEAKLAREITEYIRDLAGCSSTTPTAFTNLEPWRETSVQTNNR
jgi:hypothetical protein